MNLENEQIAGTLPTNKSLRFDKSLNCPTISYITFLPPKIKSQFESKIIYYLVAE